MKWKLEQPHSRIHVKAVKEGESIEEKMRKITTGQEKIENVAPLIYTEKKDGALPQYDHRTDRFEQAIKAMDRVASTRAAMRQAAIEAAKAEAAKSAEEGLKPQN